MYIVYKKGNFAKHGRGKHDQRMCKGGDIAKHGMRNASRDTCDNDCKNQFRLNKFGFNNGIFITLETSTAKKI